MFGDLAKQIGDAWAKTAPPSLNIANTKRVAVGFTLKNDGTIAGDKVTVEESSGDPALDDAGVRAVRAAAPFKTVARTFKAQEMQLHVTFDDDVAHSPLGFGNP
ncbi:MAG TPA: TonB family protein [Candidatus Acidoferrales bacterium]